MTQTENSTTARKQAYAEDIGLFFERSGLPRMAGRILGWLLVAEPPHQSMPQLADALQASKGSISVNTRFLIEGGLLERISIPGSRRDHYRIPKNAWIDLMARKQAEIVAMRQIAERGLNLLDETPSADRSQLQEMHDLYRYFEIELPRLMADYPTRRPITGD